MFHPHCVFIRVIYFTISQIRVTFVVLKLESAAVAQSIENGQLMVLKVGAFQ
jgi:hypothetical protein